MGSFTPLEIIPYCSLRAGGCNGVVGFQQRLMPRSVLSPAIAGLEFLTGFTSSLFSLEKESGLCIQHYPTPH